MSNISIGSLRSTFVQEPAEIRSATPAAPSVPVAAKTAVVGNAGPRSRTNHLGFFKFGIQQKQNSLYFKSLDDWAAKGERGEQRGEAVKRYKDWVNRGDRERALNVSAHGLRSLPPSPPGLKYLYAGDNKLTELPELPAGLLMLSAPNNRLTSLPEQLPLSLTDLNVFGNRLETLSKNITQLENNYSLINVSRNPLSDAVCAQLDAVTKANSSTPILFDRKE